MDRLSWSLQKITIRYLYRRARPLGIRWVVLPHDAAAYSHG
jgi:hypothetical protein